MANFPSFTFTAAGRAAITRSLSGKNVDRLIITKCVLGDGVYSGDIDSLKDVTSPKMTVTVSEYTDNGDGTSVTRFVYDNASLDVGFSHREMGIYAKNGDSGTELLLCYSNAGNQYSYIRAGTVDSVTKQRKATIPPQTFKFVLATGGSGSVNAVIDPKGYVDVEMLEEHNTDPTAHPDIRQMLNSYLPLTGGTVTGTLNVSTQDTMDNSTKVANTAFVQSAVDSKVSKLVNSAPETLDTLNELSKALGNDPNFATTVTEMIGLKEDKTEVNNKIALHNTDEQAHSGLFQKVKNDSVKRAVDILAGRAEVILTPLIDWERNKKERGGTDVRTGSPTDNYLYALMCGADVVGGKIYLKTAFTNYDELIFRLTDDARKAVCDCTYNTKEFYEMLNGKGEAVYVNCGAGANGTDISCSFWGFGTFNNPFSAFKSTVDCLCTNTGEGWENCGLVEIYGVTYPRA